MKNKSINSTPASGKLKFLALIFLTSLFFCVNAQDTTAKNESFLQVINPIWIKDTTGVMRLGFTIRIQEPARLRSLSAKLLNRENTVVSDLGTYELKRHSKGFFYIENMTGGKITVLNNSIYFMKRVEEHNSSPGIKIKVNYTTEGNNNNSLIFSVD